MFVFSFLIEVTMKITFAAVYLSTLRKNLLNEKLKLSLTLLDPGGGGADLPPTSRNCVYACVYAYTRADFL